MADLKQLEILKQGVDAWNRYVQLGVKINLSWADLEGAVLLEADLHAANLRWAKLKGADCRTVINDAGEREFTDLSETEGLTPWQIETMDGDRGVILPDHLTYPEDWPEPPESTAVPEQPEGPFVFISYAHDNKREVSEITRYLRAHKINIWWDDDILPGDPWREQIQANLENCQAVLTLWTEQSVGSKSVIEEAAAGKRQGKLLHAKLDSAPLPYGFGEVQYADLTNWDRQSDGPESLRLIEALRQKLDPDAAKVRQHLDAASPVEFTARNGKVTLGDKPLNTPPPAQNPKDLDNLRTASVELIDNIQEEFSTRNHNFDVDALDLRLSQYANVLRQKTDNWYKYENAVRRIKSMKDEAAAGAWSNRLISDITALFERHEEMRKYLQPEQPPAGTPGAIGPAPLAAGKADAPAIAQQWQEAISDPKLSDIVDPGVTDYFKDLNADLKEPLSETPLSYEQDDRKNRKIMRGLVNLAKAAAGFTTAATAGLTATVIGDPIAAQHILAQFNAILDKLLKIFY
ncbi:TIR domain-containing protein [uncultured Planktomarina sp.]|jgi:hypothetical protein|uniref:TIR domain-containing protein n=2 Tax=uncultured Planktomarina sp. TaxID=1538529 RepID=UPI0032603AC9